MRDPAPMNERTGWNPTLSQSCWAALGLGLLAFIKDWSGYNRLTPSLISPRPISEIWWHFPAAVAFFFVLLQMVRSLDWAKDRSTPYWLASIVALIVLATLGISVMFWAR
jgi:hypothetical protein